MSGYSEDELIEQPAISLFSALRWEPADRFHEFEQPGGSPLGRETASEVVLVRQLRAALEKLNPGLPPVGITQAIEEITRDRSRMSLAAANQEVYRLLKDGVKAKTHLGDGRGKGKGERRHGEERDETVKVIDWSEPGNNNFFLRHDDPGDLRPGEAPRSGGELHALPEDEEGPGEAGRQEPPVPWGQQRHRGSPAHQGEPGAAGRVLAHAGQRQERVHVVVVTDRTDLDDQIYGNFVDTGAITEEKAQAESGKELQRRLTEDHRYVFMRSPAPCG